MMVPGAVVRSGWDHYFGMLVDRREEGSTSRNEGLYLIVDYALETLVHGGWREYPASVFLILIWASAYLASTEIVRLTLVRP